MGLLGRSSFNIFFTVAPQTKLVVCCDLMNATDSSNTEFYNDYGLHRNENCCFCAFAYVQD